MLSSIAATYSAHRRFIQRGGSTVRTLSIATTYSLGAHRPHIHPSVWIAPSATVIGNVIVREASSIWFGATVRGDQAEPIEIGRRTNIQEGTVLHADPGKPCTIGDDVTVGHKAHALAAQSATGIVDLLMSSSPSSSPLPAPSQAMLHGCTIGDGSLIGIGAIVLNGAEIGHNCLVGAHTLIPEGKKIPPGSLVVGSPGKVAPDPSPSPSYSALVIAFIPRPRSLTGTQVVRQLTEEQIAGLTRSATNYVANAKRFRDELRPAPEP